MTKLTELMADFKAISQLSNKVSKRTGYSEYEDMSLIDFDRKSAEDLFLVNELKQILYALEDISTDIDYLTCPIKYESTLFENAEGRYETEKGDCYTSGRLIEYLSKDEHCHDYPFWRKSSIEKFAGMFSLSWKSQI